jgi:tetratricopeptide (TPR) repeat protein
MKRKNNLKSNGNVVYFPKLDEKLVDKGMAALKGKHFVDANCFFNQLVEIDPNHPQGNIGLVLSLIELGELEKARKLAELLLKKGIGDYYDVIQIYLSILIQIGDYNEVSQLIEVVREEESIPPEMLENFNQILSFSKKMKQTRVSEEDIHRSGESVEEAKLVELLSTNNVNSHWEAVHLLQEIESTGIGILPLLEQFLLDTSKDPMIKTAIIQIIQEKDLAEMIEMEKFGQRVTINVQELEDPFNQSFNVKVFNLVFDQLEQENPSLNEIAKQLWLNYILTLYPILPEPLDEKLWAVALLKAGHELNGIEFSIEQYLKVYNVRLLDVQECAEKIINNEHLISGYSPPFT